MAGSCPNNEHADLPQLASEYRTSVSPFAKKLFSWDVRV
jgi:hypothetical protein